MTYYTVEDTIKQKLMLVEDRKTGKVYQAKEGYAEKLEKKGVIKRLAIEGTQEYNKIARESIRTQTNEENKEFVDKMLKKKEWQR